MSEGRTPVRPEGALWLYTLLHRVTMWWWLRHVGVIAEGERHDLIAALEAMAVEAKGEHWEAT